MSFQMIEVSSQNRVATITLNRPELSNAFAAESYGEIKQAVEELGSDGSIGAIVITGKGKHFSAGGDIKRFKQLVDSKTYLQADKILYADGMSIAIRNCPKPVIAMINGVATGAGLSCALACDFRVVSSSSKMIMGFVNMGIPGDTCSIYTLTRLLGVDKAAKMMMSGDTVKGEEAFQIGLATILAQEDKLAEATYEFAEKLANKSTDAIAGQKRLINKYFYGDMENFCQDEAAEMQACSRLPDFAEAVNAFLEKRVPVYNKKPPACPDSLK
jgi:2-(1,2-epoxy-1,2-dihydrophenyl)acetyl-CoA isomerase